MRLELSNLAKAKKSFDVRENDKDVQEINIHLTEILRLIDAFDFVPAHTLYSGFIKQTFEPLQRREMQSHHYSFATLCLLLLQYFYPYGNKTTDILHTRQLVTLWYLPRFFSTAITQSDLTNTTIQKSKQKNEMPLRIYINTATRPVSNAVLNLCQTKFNLARL